MSRSSGGRGVAVAGAAGSRRNFKQVNRDISRKNKELENEAAEKESRKVETKHAANPLS